MAVTVVQVSALSTSGAPTLSGVTAGNTLILVASAAYGNTVPDITATGYNVAGNSGLVGPGGNAASAAVLYQSDAAGGAAAPSITGPSGSYAVSAVLMEVSGLGASPTDLDIVGVVQTVSAGGGTYSVPLTGTAAQAGELIVSVQTNAYGNNPSSFNTPGGYTSVANNPSDMGSFLAVMAASYQIATGTAIDGSQSGDYASGGDTGYFGGVLVSFKAAGGAVTASIIESASATDSPSVTIIRFATQTEAAAATDSPSQTNSASRSTTETASATDSTSALRQILAAIDEAASAAQTAAATAQTTASSTEAASATDATTSAQAGVSSVDETAAAADSQQASEQVAKSATESTAATDSPASGNQLQATLTEAATATDSPSARTLLTAAAQEVASATDTLTALLSQVVAVDEAARAQDLIAQINSLSAAITEAANATDAPITIQTLALVVSWQFYARQAARFFYAAAPFRAFYAKAPFRSFYALCQSDMAVPIPYAIDPSETKVLTLDATADLPSGVTLTGTPTVDVVVLSGSDGNAAAHFTGAVINSTPITVDTATGGTVIIATGLAVQLIASGCVNGAQYEIRITCQTSQSNNVETLKATLTCSAS